MGKAKKVKALQSDLGTDETRAAIGAIVEDVVVNVGGRMLRSQRARVPRAVTSWPEHLLARGALDIGHVHAAERFEADWRAASLMPRVIGDLVRQPGSTGPRTVFGVEALTGARAAAFDRVTAAIRTIGPTSAQWIVAVVINNHAPSAVGDAMGYPETAARARFRDALDDLAAHYAIAGRKARLLPPMLWEPRGL